MIRRLLLVSLAAAVVVAALDSAGWWTWYRTARAATIDAAAGARRIADEPAMMLPAAVQWSRRLSARELTTAPRETLVAALGRLSALQRAWFWTDPEGFKNAARVDLLEFRIPEGVENLDQALARDPTSAFLHRIKALLMRAMGDQSGSLAELALAEAIAPGLQRPEVETSAEEHDLVRLEALRRRVTLYPRQRVETTLDLARELRRRADTAEARALLEALAGHPEVEIELARWEVDEGRLEAAAGRLQAVAQRLAYPASTRVQAWSRLAEVRAALGDGWGADEAAREALRLDPSSPAPYLALATLAEGRGDLDEALEQLRRAWGVAPADIGVLRRVAAVAEAAGHPRDAQLALERAMEVDPGNPGLAALLVEHHLRHGQFMEATITLSRALDRSPTDARLIALAERLRREVTAR